MISSKYTSNLIGSLLFYTPSMKYLVLRPKSSTDPWSFPTEQINEIDDSFSIVLGLARHLCQQISLQFVPQMLTDRVVLNPKDLSGSAFDWAYLWNHLTYNDWLEHLSDCMFFQTKEPEQGKRFTYLVPIANEATFLTNIAHFSIDARLLTQEEILSSGDISSTTKSVFYSRSETGEHLQDQVVDLSVQIKAKEDLLHGENSKEHTVVFILHKTTSSRQQYVENLKSGLPRMPTKALYTGIFRQENEKWITFEAAVANSLPSDDILQNAKAIVLPGSSISAYDDIPWINNYKKWLNRVYNEFPHLKFLGICFGEQILATALGGECSKTIERQQNPAFYDVTVQKITFSDEFMNAPFVKSLGLTQNEFWLSKAHGDVVTKLDPKTLKVMGHSQKYDVEVLVDCPSAKCRLLAFQGHPEYTGLWGVRKNTRFLSFFTNQDNEELMKQSWEIYKRDSPSDHFLFRDICLSFLNY